MSLENQDKELKLYFHNYATSSELETITLKTFEGFKTRILAKIAALTLVHYINKLIFADQLII
jgi:hypothetical protein